MAEVVYIACAVASTACGLLLLRSYLRQRVRLAFWTSICFVLLAANNVLLVIDLVVLPHSVSLSLWRNLVNLAGVALLLYGMIAEAP